MDFIEALAACKDVDLFKNKSIQILITAQQENWLWIDYVAFFLPMLIQLLAFWYWSNIIIVNLDKDTGDFETQATVTEIILIGISVYDLIMEIPIIVKAKWLYFNRLIKVINLIAVILIFINVANRDTTE